MAVADPGTGEGTPPALCILLPSFGMGGAEKVGLNLANHFASLGLAIDLVALTPQGSQRAQISPAVRVVDLGAKRARFAVAPLRRYFAGTRPPRVLSVLGRTNIFAGFACLGLRRAPLLFFREASPMRHIENLSWSGRALHLALTRFCYSKAARLISNSAETKADLIRYRIPHAADSAVIANPVLPADLETLLAAPIQEPWLNDPGLKVVLNVGRLYPAKDQATLVRAFARVAAAEPDARLLILGEGPEGPALSALIDSLGLAEKARLHPFVGNPYPYYKRAAVFALTSRWEGFGNVLVEALASGLPVVSTDCPGGPRGILGDGAYGNLAAMGNPQSVADSILQTLRFRPDPGRLRERAGAFGVAKIAALYAAEMGMGKGMANEA